MDALTEAPKFALRFKRGDARILHALADRVRNAEIAGDLSTFEQAALSAELGEPLVVVCTGRDQAEEMAALYSMLGTSHPAIDDLNSR